MASIDSGEVDLERFFYRTLLTIKRFSLLLIICTLLGATAGYIYNAFTKKIYGSKMLISSYVLTQSYANELIDNINLFVREGDLDVLQNKLHISREVADKIVMLSTESGLADLHLLDEKDRVFIKIRAQMQDPQSFKELEKGIVYYFENNDYAKKLFAEKKEGLQELIRTLTKQLEDMELLKSQLFSGELSKKAGPVSISVGDMVSGIAQVAEAKRDAEQTLLLLDGIQLVDGFTAFSEPQWPRKPTSILLGVALGLFIGSIIVIVRLISEFMARKAGQ